MSPSMGLCWESQAVSWSACGWSVVHLEPDEEMGPAHGMYGALDAELEVQRAIRGAELKALVSL